MPTLKADLKDTQEMAANKDKEIASANQLIGGLRQQVSALNIEITDNKKACSTQISAIKAKARHSKLSWFARGLATGAGIVAFLLH